jgi:hypothetical protein
VLALFACTDRRYPTTLVAADSLCAVNPDSALSLLTQYKDSIQTASKAHRMYYHLLLADAMNKSYVDMSTDSILTEVADYYDRHGSANEKMRAHYLLGCAYRDMGEAPMALQAYYDAISYADTTRNDCDVNILIGIYGQMAHLFHLQNLPYDEIWAVNHYIHYVSKTDNPEEYLVAQKQLIKPYYLLNKKDTVLQIINNTYQSLKSIGSIQKAASTLTTSIYIYIERGEIEKASKALSVFENESGLFDGKGNIAKGREGFYYIKGFYELMTNNIDSAELYFRKAIHYGYNSEGYKGLLAVYKRKKNADSIFFFANKYEEAQDSLHNRMQTNAIHQMSSLYKYTRSQNEAARERNRAQRAIILLIAIIMLSILLLLIIAFIILRYRKKKKEKEMEIDSLRKSLVKVKKQRSIVQEELRKLKERDFEGIIAEKEKQERDLTKIIEQLQTENKTIRKAVIATGTNHPDAFIESKIAVLFIKKAKRKSERPVPTEAEWRMLTSQFCKDNPSMYKFFSDGKGLSLLEQRICILLILGIPEKMISMMTESLPSTVSNSKTRANEKLFGKREAHSLKNNLFHALNLS